MRWILAFIFIVLLFGCLQLAQQEETPIKDEEKKPSCKLVKKEVPYNETVCEDVLVTEQKCSMREINYTAEIIGPTYICSQNGDCTGRPLDECRECTTAVARCRMRITNLDDKPGVFKVGARFLLLGDVFERNPIVKEIAPRDSEEFDFQQFYLARLVKYARCELTVLEVPEVEECVDVSSTRQQCQNVTKTRIVEERVCE